MKKVEIKNDNQSFELIMDRVIELAQIAKEAHYLPEELMQWMESLDQDWTNEEWTMWYNPYNAK
jgi:starvation-inducible outer membrane lipoprotein